MNTKNENSANARMVRAMPASLGVLCLGLAVMPSTGCGDDSPLGNLAEQCGLTCPSEGIIEGNASISGIASVDAFFGAVVDFTGAADGVAAQVNAEVSAIAISLGLEADAPIADVRGALEARIAANVEGGLTVDFQEPRCEANIDIAARAAAECDVNVDPGAVNVSCEGSCQIDASAQADCSAMGTLSCRGPVAQCEGSCSGSCNLEVAAMCEGTCNGTCNGDCSLEGADGSCQGTCDGTCQGSCELAAGGSCEGTCEGTCEFEAPSCEGGLEARCEASAEANIECQGSCEGEVRPPEVSAECQATVEAKAEASIECRPPSLEINYQFAANLDANAQAEFRAFIGSFKARYSAILAAGAKAEILVNLGGNLVSAAGDAVTNAATELSASGDLSASIGAGCALAELPDVQTAIQGSIDGVTGSVTAVAEIGAAVGGA
ncbi:MAG: hypothetical protein AAGA56_14740 [Myxococcota bacterium]